MDKIMTGYVYKLGNLGGPLICIPVITCLTDKYELMATLYTYIICCSQLCLYAGLAS